MADTIHVRGEGGARFVMDLPLPKGLQERLDAGAIVRVNPDGSPIPEAREPDQAERPPKNASAETWAAYALAQGAEPEEIEGLSRADLIELYGQD
jgi:hypothetical protein